MESDSLYLGRVVGVGITKHGKPFAVYGLSGRSDSSKERKLVIEGHDTIRVSALGDPTPEQQAKSEIFFYPAIKTGRSKESGRYAITSNGVQTGEIEKLVKKEHTHLLLNGVRGMLDKIGHEGLVGDEFNTPRIVGISLPDYHLGHDVLGTVNEHGSKSYLQPRTNGRVTWLPTYKGGKNADRTGYDLEVAFGLEDWMNGAMLGEDAQDLADDFFDMMNPDLFVSAGAAVFYKEKGEWELAVSNLHDDD